jgi:hypothetical protein
MTTIESTEEAAKPDDGWEWAIVEIMGHRRHAGRVREEERFGAKMLRIDVPVKGDPSINGWQTMYYGGSSIFSFALSDEATALRMNLPWDAPARVRLPPPEYAHGGEPQQADEESMEWDDD